MYPQGRKFSLWGDFSWWVLIMQISIQIKAKKNSSYYSKVMEGMALYSVEETPLKDLIAVIIGTSATPETCEEIASLSHTRLANLSAKDLEINFGLTPTAAKRLAAALKLQTKVQVLYEAIAGPDDVVKQLSFIKDNEKESLVVILLDSKNKVTKKEIVSVGSINSSIVHPREVFKTAIRESAASVIVGHNHPSGDPTPSREDIEVTKRLMKTGKILGIDVLDHIIVAGKRYCSLKERGYI